MANDWDKKVAPRLISICPEASKITKESQDICVEDAIYDASKAFTNSDEAVKVRGAAYLAAHYCAVQLFQNSLANLENDFSGAGTGASQSASTGDIKAVQYKDKRQEYFSKSEKSKGQAIVGWKGKTTPARNVLTGTTYGQEFIRLVELYGDTKPFLIGNDAPLGGDRANNVGDRYRRW